MGRRLLKVRLDPFVGQHWGEERDHLERFLVMWSERLSCAWLGLRLGHDFLKVDQHVEVRLGYAHQLGVEGLLGEGVHRVQLGRPVQALVVVS